MPGTLNMPVVPQIRDCGEAPLIEMRSIVKTFKNAAGEFTALRGVTACFYEGEFVSIVGKSGSGKSTLANMITGIDHPTSGQVLIGGVDIHKMNESDMSLWRGRNLGIVFQFFQLMPTLTLLENVILPMYLTGYLDAAGREKRARELLALVGLAGFEDKLPAAVSGGQQQCAAIARALANDPPILIADEPTGNLDSRTAASVFRMFEQLVGQGKTILMVTHDQDLAKRVTRTVTIADGRVINEYLARALPTLTEEQLIWATHNIEVRSYPPGAVVIHEGTPPDNFFIIAKGQVDIVLQQPGGSEMVVTTMGVGQYFGEIALLRGGTHNATVRASPTTGVDVVALDRDEFRHLVAESPSTAAAIDEVADQRAAENLAARQAGEGVKRHG